MELQVGEHNYKFGKMDVFAQFHVARKLLPVLTAFDSGDVNVWANALASMPDDHVNFVLKEALKVCSRYDGGGYRSVYNPSGVLMYHDIDLSVMIKLASESLKHNLQNFSFAQFVQ